MFISARIDTYRKVKCWFLKMKNNRRKKVWNIVGWRTDIDRDGGLTFDKFKEWVYNNAPEGTPDKEIKLTHNIGYTYDPINGVIIMADMALEAKMFVKEEDNGKTQEKISKYSLGEQHRSTKRKTKKTGR